MTTQPAERCENCRFWSAGGTGGQNGKCRRRAPVLGDEVTGWPITNLNDWCGEFVMPKEKEPCMECGKPSGVDGIAKVEHDFVTGRICKACLEKEKPAESKCTQCHGPLGEGLFKHYPAGGWTGSGELICRGCAEKLTGRKM